MLGSIRFHQRETSFRILGWVVLARRPLSLQELTAAVNCRPLYGWLTVEERVAEQVALCGPLLRVEDGNVTLVHESARGYLLLRECNGDGGPNRSSRIDVEELHGQVSKTCIDALVRDCPLSCYARQHWYYRARHSGALVSPYLYYASSHCNTHLGTWDPLWQTSNPQLIPCSTLDDYYDDINYGVLPLRVDCHPSVESWQSTLSVPCTISCNVID